MEPPYLSIAGRRYARYLNSPEVEPSFRLPWHGILTTLVLFAGSIYLVKQAGHYGEIGDVESTSQMFWLILVFAGAATVLYPLAIILGSRRHRLLHETVPERPSGERWRLVKLRGYVGGISYGADGWMQINKDSLQFRSDCFDFNLTKSDWDKVAMFEGKPAIFVPKARPVERMVLTFITLEISGRPKDIVRRLLEEVRAVEQSELTSVFPPIEGRVVPFRPAQSLLWFVGGTLVGLGIVTLLQSTGPLTPVHPDSAKILFALPVLCGLLSVIATIEAPLLYYVRHKEIKKWEKQFGPDS